MVHKRELCKLIIQTRAHTEDTAKYSTLEVVALNEVKTRHTTNTERLQTTQMTLVQTEEPSSSFVEETGANDI